MFVSIRNRLVIFTTVLLLFSFSILGYVFFDRTYNSEKESLILVAQTALKPIVNNAQISVAGANIMKLKSKDFQVLYKTSEALYIKIDGMSDKIPASLFAKEQPPKKIEYEYKSKQFGHVFRSS